MDLPNKNPTSTPLKILKALDTTMNMETLENGMETTPYGKTTNSGVFCTPSAMENLSKWDDLLKDLADAREAHPHLSLPQTETKVDSQEIKNILRLSLLRKVFSEVSVEITRMH